MLTNYQSLAHALTRHYADASITVEYPGYVLLTRRHSAIAIGNSNATWTADIYAASDADHATPLVSFDTLVPARSNDYTAVAAAVAARLAACGDQPVLVPSGLWRSEFGDAYKVPDVIAQHPSLIDQSWHNDVCPSFSHRLALPTDQHDARLWVEHHDPGQRETDGCDPFTHGRYVVADMTESPNQPEYSGDDPSLAIAALEKLACSLRN